MAENMSAKSLADVAWYHIMYSSNLGKKMRGPATDWKKKNSHQRFPTPGLSSSVELCDGKNSKELRFTVSRCTGGEVYI